MTATRRRQTGPNATCTAGSKAAGRKAVLFCPVCDHDAPVDDGWSIAEREGDDDRVDVACPTCGHVVVSQPRFARDGERGGSLLVVRPLLQLVNAVVRHDVL